MKIYVDADASPVKDIVISVAHDFGLQVVLVKSISHYSHDEAMDGVETVYVDTGADAADYRIMKLADRLDIIITQDYGLASLGLGKGCLVLHHKGFAYTNENIDQLLQTRHLSAKARRSGHKTKGPKPFTDEDRKKFQNLLRRTIQANI
ncbi:YaiI/YqxD family protein [Ornithinibacillus contaminans]|uniref:YaiI/YqxD family protein n=1 Tax=Ornithinibacillus contaminans TaxID=694055 RepID=UPI00064D7D5C|nr:YaiI/YqxD family protein [Ornithinibacillus contaminans]